VGRKSGSSTTSLYRVSSEHLGSSKIFSLLNPSSAGMRGAIRRRLPGQKSWLTKKGKSLGLAMGSAALVGAQSLSNTREGMIKRVQASNQK